MNLCLSTKTGQIRINVALVEDLLARRIACPPVARRCLREPKPPADALVAKAARQRNVSAQVNGAKKLEVEHRKPFARKTRTRGR